MNTEWIVVCTHLGYTVYHVVDTEDEALSLALKIKQVNHKKDGKYKGVIYTAEIHSKDTFKANK